VNRVIYNVYAWCVAATLLGIPGVAVASFLVPQPTARLGAWSIFVAAVLTDLISVYLDVTYLLRVGDLHGQALFAMAYYVVFVASDMSAAWWWQLVALGALTAFHIACQWHLAQPIARRLGWRPNTSGTGEQQQ